MGLMSAETTVRRNSTLLLVLVTSEIKFAGSTVMARLCCPGRIPLRIGSQKSMVSLNPTAGIRAEMTVSAFNKPSRVQRTVTKMESLGMRPTFDTGTRKYKLSSSVLQSVSGNTYSLSRITKSPYIMKTHRSFVSWVRSLPPPILIIQMP